MLPRDLSYTKAVLASSTSRTTSLAATARSLPSPPLGSRLRCVAKVFVVCQIVRAQLTVVLLPHQNSPLQVLPELRSWEIIIVVSYTVQALSLQDSLLFVAFAIPRYRVCACDWRSKYSGSADRPVAYVQQSRYEGIYM